jgi:hypothetical protein
LALFSNSIVPFSLKNEKAVPFYKDGNVTFNFTLIKFGALNPRDYIESNELELFPFIPLMNEGIKYVDDVEKKIYSGKIDKDKKADLLKHKMGLIQEIQEEIIGIHLREKMNMIYDKNIVILKKVMTI